MIRFEVTDHGIEDGKEFVHASDESDFFLLTALEQRLVKGMDEKIRPGSGDSSHVEDLANGSAPTFDTAWTAPFTAVVVEGGNPDQGSDLFLVELAQFGEIGREG